MIAVARGIRRFDGRAAFTTWCYRVATNAALDELRRQQRRPVPADPTAGPEPVARGRVDRGPGRRPPRRRRRAARASPRSSGSPSCSATSATSTTRRSPRCSTSRPAPCARGSRRGRAALAERSGTRRRAAERREPATMPRHVRPTMADDAATTRDERVGRAGSRSSRSTTSTRRRLVSTAMREPTGDAGAPTRPSPAALDRRRGRDRRRRSSAARRWSPRRAATTTSAPTPATRPTRRDRSDRRRSAAPSAAAAAAAPVDVGDFGDLDTRREPRPRSAPRSSSRGAAAAPPATASAAAPTPRRRATDASSSLLDRSACRDRLAGAAPSSRSAPGTLDGRPAIVVAHRAPDGAAVVRRACSTDPCEVRRLS